ncbi:MAG: sigma factor-like helix-turn-helix DNA-binding protein [Tsuneonella sp.]
MSGGSSPDLTDRQRAVLELIDRRMPLKTVAAELGISESRVNQHVRALKEAYGVASLKGLVEAWRAEPPQASASDDPCRKPAWRNSDLPQAPIAGETRDRVAPGEFVLADAAPFAIEAPWLGQYEPRVVPGVLDGDHAVLIRLAVIVGLAFGMIAVLVLVMTASLNLSEALGDQGSIPQAKSAPAK